MLDFLARDSLRSAVAKSIVIPMILLTLLASGISILATNKSATEQLETRLIGLMQSSAIPIRELLWRLDREEMQVLLDNFVLSGVLVGALVSDDTGFRVAAGDTTLSDSTASVSLPLRHLHDGQFVEIGTMLFVASKGGVFMLARSRAASLALIASTAIALTTLLILALMQRRVILPIAEIENGLRKVSDTPAHTELRLSPATERKMIHELSAVVDAINHMRGDISRAREELWVSNAQLSTAAKFASLGHGIVSLGRSRFISFDENLERMLGMTADELRQVDLADTNSFLFLVDQKPGEQASRLADLRDGKAIYDSFELNRRNGELREFRVTVGPLSPEIRRQDGDDDEYQIVVQDVTEYRRAENRLHQMGVVAQLTAEA